MQAALFTFLPPRAPAGDPVPFVLPYFVVPPAGDPVPFVLPYFVVPPAGDPVPFVLPYFGVPPAGDPVPFVLPYLGVPQTFRLEWARLIIHIHASPLPSNGASVMELTCGMTLASLTTSGTLGLR